MSATLPPAAIVERPSDFGEFWSTTESAPHPESVLPEPEAPPLLSLTPAQQARRARLRRAVAGVVLGLLAFTVLATGIYGLRRRAAAIASSTAAKPVALAQIEPGHAAAASAPPAPVTGQANTQPAEPVPSATDRALALARTPVATAANLKTWSELARQLSPPDRKLAEHELSRLSVTGERPVREAARLQLALLWRATDRSAKAHKVLVSLARTAADPLVKKVALDTLRAA